MRWVYIVGWLACWAGGWMGGLVGWLTGWLAVGCFWGRVRSQRPCTLKLPSAPLKPAPLLPHSALAQLLAPAEPVPSRGSRGPALKPPPSPLKPPMLPPETAPLPPTRHWLILHPTEPVPGGG